MIDSKILISLLDYLYFLTLKPFNFDKLNNLDDKIDIEELEIDSDLDEEDNDYYSEKIHLLILFYR